ncbi:MAG: ABC transporter substrate-binding protein [Nocardioidaceae bacterium]|nr:ABC transporter substrate-binding protein [Nocardioidaceae bacterium]
MTRPSRVARIAAIAAASALALAACGGGGDSSDESSAAASSSSGSTNKQIYFVDGNTADYSSDFDAGTLAGVKATYPGPKLADDFRERLLGVDSSLKDFTYAQESYDAVILAALAAEAADSDNSKAIAEQMQAVSSGGTKCTSFPDCKELLDNDEDIDYDGVSGPVDFNATGSPSAATIGIYEYGEDNNYKAVDYEEGEVTDSGEPAANQQITGDVPDGDGTFTVGSLLPQTGDLAFLGPPEIAGVKLAVNELNEAGGVLGADATIVQADSGDGTPNIAPQEVDKLLAANSDVIVGAASSSVSLSVIDKIVNAGVLQISPANTSTAFDTYADKGLYFRTAPSDVLQGNVMANLLTDDGNTDIAILARQDSYGEALADNVEKFFTEAGGNVVVKKLYAPDAANFTAEVNDVKGADPDAIVLIAFDETKKIIPEMIKAGIGPNS